MPPLRVTVSSPLAVAARKAGLLFQAGAAAMVGPVGLGTCATYRSTLPTLPVVVKLTEVACGGTSKYRRSWPVPGVSCTKRPTPLDSANGS